MKRHSAREAQQPSFRVRPPTIPAQATYRGYMVVCDASIDADYVSRNVERWFNTFVETCDSQPAQEARIDQRDVRYLRCLCMSVDGTHAACKPTAHGRPRLRIEQRSRHIATRRTAAYRRPHRKQRHRHGEVTSMTPKETPRVPSPHFQVGLTRLLPSNRAALSKLRPVQAGSTRYIAYMAELEPNRRRHQ